MRIGMGHAGAPSWPLAPRDVFGQCQRQRRGPPGAFPLAFQRQTHGVGMWHIPANSFEQCRLQCRCPVLVEQTQQLSSDATQASASQPRCARAWRLCSTKACKCRRSSSPLMSIKAARVTGQFGDAVEDANALLIGQDQIGRAHV